MIRQCFVLFVGGLLLGCGASHAPGTYLVRGKVTLDGEPVEKGSVVLDPKDGSGSAAMGGVEHGTFEFRAPPGEKIVRFAAHRETMEKDEYGEKVVVSIIPDKYNGQSVLTATIAEEENELPPFELTTK
ncbi:hypothetical protein Pan216_03350 [Planctomycetes bacterium Pan216]|uniref:Carboxypeptidase regulatory-like domain-containing protein n=1 Tax=Kolteria novifilia TaxID=2527975 RepID=A0A518AXP8_9BACT|nr:hypothetical protein Pan216_03350 [Planctomycetes bacterium Pan216]